MQAGPELGDDRLGIARHVVAVSTIVSRHRSIRQAGLVGAAWGLGHTLTVFVVGGAIILFGWVMPARLGLAMEFAVAVMLVLLGIGTIAGLRRHHRHERGTHSHTADDAVAWLDRRFDGGTLYMLVRPLLVGVVHGLAGSAAVALLVMSAIGDPIWALVYLGVFGVGTILGMITPADLAKVERRRWHETAVIQVAHLLHELRSVSPDTTVAEALHTMGREDLNQLPVITAGRMEGMLSRSHILQALQTRSELSM